MTNKKLGIHFSLFVVGVSAVLAIPVLGDDLASSIDGDVNAALAQQSAASGVAAGDGLANAAYFVVNLHYCAPPAVTLAGTRPVPSGDAAIVYQEVLMGAYGGNCEDFYAGEVKPRVYLSDDQS